MNDMVLLAVSILIGGVLGVMFFAGLWWTIHRGLASTAPALWFVGSLWVRTFVVVAGLYLMAQGDWRRLACGVVGFVVARTVVARWARGSAAATKPSPAGGLR